MEWFKISPIKIIIVHVVVTDDSEHENGGSYFILVLKILEIHLIRLNYIKRLKN